MQLLQTLTWNATSRMYARLDKRRAENHPFCQFLDSLWNDTETAQIGHLAHEDNPKHPIIHLRTCAPCQRILARSITELRKIVYTSGGATTRQCKTFLNILEPIAKELCENTRKITPRFINLAKRYSMDRAISHLGITARHIKLCKDCIERLEETYELAIQPGMPLPISTTKRWIERSILCLIATLTQVKQSFTGIATGAIQAEQSFTRLVKELIGSRLIRAGSILLASIASFACASISTGTATLVLVVSGMTLFFIGGMASETQ